jgi:hypothetical protein
VQGEGEQIHARQLHAYSPEYQFMLRVQPSLVCLGLQGALPFAEVEAYLHIAHAIRLALANLWGSNHQCQMAF